MKYQIASSSTEEGEVHENTFPYSKSHLKYLYHPNTTLFIGPNSLPTLVNYRSESVCQKLKKDIKADYPYVSFTLLESNRAFFDNHFTPAGDLTVDRRTFSLISIHSDYKEITTLRRGEDTERYSRFFKQQLFSAEPPTHPRVFILEDRMLEAFNNPNAYLFLRVTEEAQSRRYGFEEVFYSQCQLYEYLEIYGETLVRSHGSEEVRRYEAGDALLLLHSSTAFTSGGKVHRLFSTPETTRDRMVVLNREGAKLQEVQGRLSKTMERLVTLAVGEGDYVINKGTVYRMEVGSAIISTKEGSSREDGTTGNGESVRFKYRGLSYEDLL